MLIENKFSTELLPGNVEAQLVQKVKILRKKEGYTQQELADRSGVSLGSLKRFERTGKISLEGLLRVAHVFNRLNDFSAVFDYNDSLDIVKQKFTV